MSAVEVLGVTLARGRREVLRDVSVVLGDAEFVGLLGPNGAGKTTLIRAILGLERPVRGRIAVFGRPAARGNPAVGYMPQQRNASPSLRLRGWDIVAGAVAGHRWGLPLASDADRRDIAQALDLVGATALAERKLGELSGGERQRLLLAQALLGRPRLLLMDEPLASLDPRHQQAMVALVRQVQQHLGITVLFSAHDLNPVLAALDRVLYLGGGKAALGPVEQVVTGPVLSALYGTPIEVARVAGRIFVMAGSGGVGCSHEHGGQDGRP